MPKLKLGRRRHRSRHPDPGAEGMNLSISTLLRRDGEDYDVRIEFDATITSPYVPAQTYGPAEDCYPAEGPEWEANLTGFAFDPPDASLPPITEAERVTLTAWLDAHDREVGDAIMDADRDHCPPDPDEARDRDFDRGLDRWNPDPEDGL
jgi:hypothetical protein